MPTPSPTPTLTPSPSPTPEPTATPTPTPTPVPEPVLSRDPIRISFSANADALLSFDANLRNRERERLRQEIALKMTEAGIQTQRAGFVLTFGTSPSPVEGERLSREVNVLLRETLPSSFGNAVLRDYHDIQSAPQLRGVITLEIFLFVESH